MLFLELLTYCRFLIDPAERTWNQSLSSFYKPCESSGSNRRGKRSKGKFLKHTVTAWCNARQESSQPALTLAHITQAQTAQLAQQAQANAEKAARDAASAAAPRHESGQVFDASQLAAAYAAGPARPTAQPKHAPVAAGAAGAVLATEAIHGKSEITETLFPIKVDGTPFTLIPLQNKDGLYLSYAILIENKINAEHIAAFRTALELGQLDSDHIKKLTGMNNGFELRLHGQLGDHRVLGKQHEGEEVICQALQSALPADQQDSIDYLLKALPILEGASHKRLIVFYYQTNHTGIDNWVQKNR